MVDIGTMEEEKETSKIKSQADYFLMAKAKKGIGKARKSHAKGVVVNQRPLKICVLCGKQNKQMARHIAKVHGKKCDEQTITMAKKTASVHRRKAVNKVPENLCPICHEYRNSLSRHLTVFHGINRKSAEIEGKGLKVAATRRIANGKYADVEEIMMEYESLHFGNICGHKRSIKPETNEITKKRRVATMRKLLRWLVDKTGETEIHRLVEKLPELGSIPSGYFVSNWKTSTLGEIGCISDFLDFCETHQKLEESLIQRSRTNVKRMRWNIINRFGIRCAKFQEADKVKTVSPEQMAQFYSSKPVQEAKRRLDGREPQSASVREVARVRDYLIFSLMEENRLRPCSLYALEVDPFLEENAVYNRNGQLEVPLFYDKNVGKTRKCNYLHLEREKVCEVRAYIKYYRPLLLKKNTTDVQRDLFLNEKGERLDNNGLSRCQRNMWTRAGAGIKNFPTTSNSRHLRKSSNKTMYEEGSGELRAVAHEVLNHRRETNASFYQGPTRGDRIGKAKQKLRSLENAGQFKITKEYFDGCFLNLNIFFIRNPKK